MKPNAIDREPSGHWYQKAWNQGLSLVKGALHGQQGSLTPQQKACRRTALAVTGVAVLFFATKLYNLWSLSQITDIECSNDSTYYITTADNGDIEALYCLAGMYKDGTGVEQSLEKARTLYQAVWNQGLYLARWALCDRSLYADWSPQQLAEGLELLADNICCPPGSRSAYPGIC